MLLNQYIRYYLPIKELLKNNKNIKTLDVGSGDLGIGEFYKGKFYGLDKEIKNISNPNMIKINATAENIPFDNNYFDYVFSVDLLEHIIPKNRIKVINEIIRVTKIKAIIGFPCGKKSKEIDYKIYQEYLSKRVSIPDWLKDHLNIEYPLLKPILSNLNKKKLKYYIKPNENCYFHMVIMKLEMNSVVCKIFDVFLKKFRPFINTVVELLNFGECYRKYIIIEKYE